MFLHCRCWKDCSCAKFHPANEVLVLAFVSPPPLQCNQAYVTTKSFLVAITDIHHKHRIYAFLSNVVEGRLRRFMQTWLWENLVVLWTAGPPKHGILQARWFGDTNGCSQHRHQLTVDWNGKDQTPTSAPSKRSGKGRDSEMTWCSTLKLQNTSWISYSCKTLFQDVQWLDAACNLRWFGLTKSVRLWVWDDTKQKIVQKEAVALETYSCSCLGNVMNFTQKSFILNDFLIVWSMMMHLLALLVWWFSFFH